MIIDWIQPIKTFTNDPGKESLIIELLKKDFGLIRESLFNADTVIIRIDEGYRLETKFIYEIGPLDPKKVMKDFTRIREFRILNEKVLKLAGELKELWKDYPEQVENIDNYMKQMLQFPLFAINFVRDNKIVKSISGIPYDFIEAYIEGILLCYKIDVNPEADD